MHWVDWLIVLLPISVIILIGWRVQKHVRAVSDFLTGGRVAGRYLVAVASGEAALGLISVVALFELYYRTGFAIGFWSSVGMPVTLLITLTGFAIYRYRETRVMTMAQFFEVRYSRRFRIFGGILAWLSGVLNYALFPAVGGRFIVHYCDSPPAVEVIGFQVPTFGLVMAIFLTVAVVIVLIGGQLTTMVTDCVAGIFSYGMYAVVIMSVLMTFSWEQMNGALLARPPGQSMIDPFDTAGLAEFNVLFVLIGVFGMAYNIMSWQGSQAYNAAAVSPHEQKMGKVLSTWRSGLSVAMILLLAVAAWTYMNHADFSAGGAAVRAELAQDINLSTDASTQQIREQMLVPVAVRHFLPIGVVGAFCGAMVFLLISTDTTYLHSWGSIFVQDIVLPLRKAPLTPRQQIWLLRCSIAFVAVFAFVWSLHFNQVTYILMFFSLTGSVYLGGAGAVIIGGLYWKRGTAAGAWAAMLVGSGIAITGFCLTQFWPSHLYPYLLTHAPDALAAFYSGMQSLGELLPLVNWNVRPDRFPISGQEWYLLTMLAASTSYVCISLLTCKRPFDLNRMLHRTSVPPASSSLRKFDWKRSLLGFDSQFTRADKALAISVFVYSVALFLFWLGVVLWNVTIARFSAHAWVNYFWIVNIAVSLAIGIVTTVWFTFGAIRDLRQMFDRLHQLQRDPSDDGRIVQTDQEATPHTVAVTKIDSERVPERLVDRHGIVARAADERNMP